MRATLGWLLALAVCAIAVITVAPAWVGLSETLGFAHVVALRGLASLASIVLGLGLLVSWGVRRRRVPRSRRRRGARLGRRRLVLALLLIAVGLAHGAVQFGRGTSATAASVADAGLTIIAFNTQGAPGAPAAIAALAERERADAVALPETGAQAARDAARRLGERGREYQVFTEREGADPVGVTSLLISADLGSYRRIAAPYMRLGAVRVAPVDGDGPVISAVHPPPPVPVRFGMADWARYAAVAAGMCPEIPGSIVAGDFNATVDHASLQGLDPCRDAAVAAGAGAEGTWPARLPHLLASPIDHVLLDGRAWDVTSARAVRAGGSDHRALIARLAPR